MCTSPSRLVRALVSAVALCSSAGACTRGYEPVSEADVIVGAPEPAPRAAPVAPEPAPPHSLARRRSPQLAAPAAASSGAAPVAALDEAASAGGLRWTAAPPLVARRPSVAMRAAEYVVAGDGESEAVLSVFHFGAGMGGSVDDNVSRWAGQLRTERGEAIAPTITRRTVGALPITIVEAEGQMSTGMPGATQPAPLVRAHLLGAIVEGPQGLVFFKLSGPPATVESARAAFDALLASLAPG